MKKFYKGVDFRREEKETIGRIDKKKRRKKCRAEERRKKKAKKAGIKPAESETWTRVFRGRIFGTEVYS